MTVKVLQNNFYDFDKITLEDMQVEQASNNTNVALTNDSIAGSGVRLSFPQEPVIFDSDSLTVAQSGFEAVNTFDGRGILASPVLSSDLDEGTQVSVTISDARLTGSISTIVTIIGKTFDNDLTYEHLVFKENGTRLTKNHFTETTNILFQNFRGNANTLVDGYGCFDVGGRALVTEASSYKVSHDLIADEWTSEPDILFRNFKTYDPAKTIQAILEEAIGSDNDIDDLNINTTTASTRTFAEGASTETIYAQKFRMKGTNIQKVTLLLGLESGSTWSGSIVVGIRPLLTSTTCPTDFLPENEIEFDPDTVPIEELSFDSDDLAERGIVLTSDAQPVDFVFTDAQISNPNLSGLVDQEFYAITVKRSGSSSTGTIFLEEARNDDSEERRLSVFTGNGWTDVPNSTFWYRVWSDSVKIASGTAYDEGVRLPILKTYLQTNGVFAQNVVEDINLVNTSENTENYVIVKKDIAYSDVEVHPRTGDPIFSRQEDTPAFSVLEQSELLTLMVAEPKTVVLARVRDNNARSNPIITGTLDYPGLALGNVINIVNPGNDLLNQNVVGSTITPDVLNPTLQYRITSQETIVDLYGDVDGDGDIDVFDQERITEIDGYQAYLATTGDYSSAIQQAAVLAGEVSILEILRADVDSSDGYEITAADLSAVTDFIENGTAFPNGLSSFTRVELTVEPVLNPLLYYNSNANSTINLEVDNPDLIDPSMFSFGTGINFSISFIPTWNLEQVEILDLRRFVTTTFLDFDSDDIQQSPENGGQNNLFVPGDLFLSGAVKSLDGDPHPLDVETTVVELELPAGDSEGEINIFEEYVEGVMQFSDGTLVSNSALNNDQVRFEVSIGSFVKNLANAALDPGGLGDADGYGLDFDGYNDGYGENADEVIGTYIDHDTGLLRIRAFNIVRNTFFPELRSRVIVTVHLRKAGFANEPVYVDSTTLTSKLQAFAP